jgi:hypothetical protein
MKKQFIFLLLSVGLIISVSSCNDFLDVKSPSVVDQEFVFSNLQTANAVMSAINERWRVTTNDNTFSNGAFYALDATGSDIEHHPEPYVSQLDRHRPEGFYENGEKTSAFNIDFSTTKNAYSALYGVITLANNAISAIESRADYNEIINAQAPSVWGFMYGQAVAARAASYLDLTRYYGDVTYLTYGGAPMTGLTPRDVIYEGEIEKLKLVEPLMYRPGEKTTAGETVGKGVFNRTFVQGLIGRLCVYAAGYGTRRNDITYTDLAGNVLSFEKKGTDNNGAFYGRRTDYQKFYTTAKTYLEKAVTNPGTTVIFHDTDPRATKTDGRVFNNPFQYFFQQLMDNAANTAFADESVYEIPMTQGASGNNERPYAMGRVSKGGGTNAFPCKAYGQGRMQPAYYYGWFDNNDKRRDVTVTVTGSSGDGVEELIPFTRGSTTNGGGLCLNKYDENRQTNPWYQNQRRSGINQPFMRISDLYLLYAEVNAALGNNGDAREYLRKVRERAFETSALADVDGFIAREGSLYNAIIKERAFEFGGEGDRRNVLIRTGLVPEAILAQRAQNEAMVAGLVANKSYKFANGNTFANYIWKAVG